MQKMSGLLDEIHRGSPTLTWLNVLGVLNMLDVLNVPNMLNTGSFTPVVFLKIDISQLSEQLET